MKGRAAGRDGRASRRRCARARRRCRARSRRVRHLRHRRRRRAHVQRLDRRGARAGRLRRARRQARQSRGVEPLRQRRSCSRRSASNIDGAPAIVERCLEEAGIAFFFAQAWHPSMRHAGADAQGAGRPDGVQPARTADQSGAAPRGSWSASRARSRPSCSRARSAQLGSERAWVVHGADGLDEISTTGYTKVSECRDGAVNTFYLHPADVGLPVGAARRCAAATPPTTPRSLERVLAGEAGARARHRAAERRARRCSSPGRATTIPRGHRAWRPKRSTPAAPRRSLRS